MSKLDINVGLWHKIPYFKINLIKLLQSIANNKNKKLLIISVYRLKLNNKGHK